MSMLCQVCKKNSISTLKPPYGGYICSQHHFQCPECVTSQTRCKVCGEATQFLQFTVITSASAKVKTSSEMIASNELGSLGQSTSKENEHLLEQIDSMPQILMDDEDLNQIFRTLSRSEWDTDTIPSKESRSLLALLPISQETEELKAKQSAPGKMQKENTTLPGLDHEPTKFSLLTQTRSSPSQFQKTENDNQLSGVDEKALNLDVSVQHFDPKNSLVEEKSSHSRSPNLTSLKGPENPKNLFSNLDESETPRPYCPDEIASCGENSLEVKQGPVNVKRPRREVPVFHSNITSVSKDFHIPEVDVNNLSNETESPQDNNTSPIISQLKNVPFVLLPLDELLKDNTLLESLAFQAALISLAGQDKNKAMYNKARNTKKPAPGAPNSDNQKSIGVEAKMSSQQTEWSDKQAQTDSTTKEIPKPSKILIDVGTATSPSLVGIEKVSDKDNQQEVSKSELPENQKPESALSPQNKYFVMHATESLPSTLGKTKGITRLDFRQNKGKGQVDERYMKLLQSFLEEQAESKESAETVVNENAGAYLSEEAKIEIPLTVQDFKEIFGDIPDELKMENVFKESTKQAPLQSRPVPDSKNQTLLITDGIKKKIEEFNNVEPSGLRASSSQNFERPASQIVVEDHQNSPTLNEIFSQQKMHLEKEMQKEETIPDARLVLINRAPLRCPENGCNQSLFVSDFCQHIVFDHNNVPLERIQTGQEKIFFCDVRSLARNAPRCIMCYFLKDVVKNVGSSGFKDYLPVMVMASRVKCIDMYHLNPAKVTDNPANDFYFFWLTGLVPEKRPIGYELVVYPLYMKKSDLRVGSRNYVYSLRSSQKPYDIWSSGSGLLFYPREMEKLTNNMNDILIMKLVVT